MNVVYAYEMNGGLRAIVRFLKNKIYDVQTPALMGGRLWKSGKYPRSRINGCWKQLRAMALVVVRLSRRKVREAVVSQRTELLRLSTLPRTGVHGTACTPSNDQCCISSMV